MDKNREIAVMLAQEIGDIGGKVYYVGGCVRDEMLLKENKDIDIEVYGITPDKLKEICKKHGRVDEVGASFGVLKIHGYDIDITMPRTERTVGAGHKAFAVHVDPFMSTKEAAARRDFTMNALMKDVLTGEIIDHFGGLADLENKKIRHISDKSFIEDPLRVFRAAGFAARLGFKVADETVELCRQVDVSPLSKERVFEETNKVFLKSYEPSVYFETLRKTDQLKNFFPGMEKLIGVKQNPEYHPEGDVWTHTMMVIDNAAVAREDASYPLGFMYAAAFHDISKPATTVYDERKQTWKSIGHEEKGAEESRMALSILTSDKKLTNYVKNMVEMHMRPTMVRNRSSFKVTNRMFDKSVSPKDLILLHYCDIIGRKEINPEKVAWWDERINIYHEMLRKPEVTGDDLIRLGYIPGPNFSKVLKKCHDIHLAGVPKEDVLKQLPGIMKDMGVAMEIRADAIR